MEEKAYIDTNTNTKDKNRRKNVITKPLIPQHRIVTTLDKLFGLILISLKKRRFHIVFSFFLSFLF